MNKKLYSLLLAITLFSMTISSTVEENRKQKQAKVIEGFKINPRAATQWTGVLCTLVAACSILSNPIVSIPVLAGGVYTITNPEKVIEKVEQAVESAQSEEQMERTTKKVIRKIRTFFKNLFAD